MRSSFVPPEENTVQQCLPRDASSFTVTFLKCSVAVVLFPAMKRVKYVSSRCNKRTN